jgi:UDP-N-acetylmuramate dehydrogenase
MSSLRVTPDVCLAGVTYYRTGGPCALLYEPASVVELRQALHDIQTRQLPFFVLGRGSNTLVMDDRFEGAVILLRGLNEKHVQGTTVTLGAGLENSEAAEYFASHDLTGGEWLWRLPGEIGGTTRMNARCYGGEMSAIVTSVSSMTFTGLIKTYAARQVFRGYKDTIFCDNSEIAVAATFDLKHGDAALIRDTMKRCENDRLAKNQFAHPSCGCVFKNDYSVGTPSGRLMEQAGLKGRRLGDAQISPDHANFIFNVGQASARDILTLAMDARDEIKRVFGVVLKLEMEIRGAIPDDLEKRLKSM